MRIGFIGAGKVGFTLGKYFKIHNIQLSGYFSRSIDSAREAAAFTETQCFHSIEEVLSASDILFLTAPDSALKEIWNNFKKLPIKGKIVCHCSGLMSSANFDGIDHCGAFGYSVHPLFAISSKMNSYKQLGEAIFAIEGSEERLFLIKQMFENLGNKVCIIKTEQKIKYHSAAVFLSNHVTALAHLGCKLLHECGFENEFSNTVLSTLFLNNCKAIAENGIVDALTGPIERNDLLTVKKHINCLPKNEKLLYILLSEILMEIAKKKNEFVDYSNIKECLFEFREEIK